MKRRLVLVYNPNSSHFKKMEKKVLRPARKREDLELVEFQVKRVVVERNVTALTKILKKGDLVVSMGGDGTATMTLNAILKSGKEGIFFGVLGYGNFNDVAMTIGSENFDDILDTVDVGEVREVWPVECHLDGKLWRYGMGYFTVGMMAEACSTFEERKNRKELKRGDKSVVFSVWRLFTWWRKNRKKEFLPEVFCVDGEENKKKSDILVLNGRRMGKLIRGGMNASRPDEMLFYTGKMSSWAGILGFMLRSMLFGMPSEIRRKATIEFDKKTQVMIQGEGEFKKTKVKKIELIKSRKSVFVTGTGAKV